MKILLTGATGYIGGSVAAKLLATGYHVVGLVRSQAGLIKLAKKSDIARYIGKGENSWSHVHIDDVVDLYLLAMQQAPAGSFFFVENGEATMKGSNAPACGVRQIGGRSRQLDFVASLLAYDPILICAKKTERFGYVKTKRK